jgi:hypothetical protein
MTPDPKTPQPCDVIEMCPVCGGAMETVYSRAHEKVCVCNDCHTSITVPATAWDVPRDNGGDTTS